MGTAEAGTKPGRSSTADRLSSGGSSSCTEGEVENNWHCFRASAGEKEENCGHRIARIVQPLLMEGERGGIEGSLSREVKVGKER